MKERARGETCQVQGYKFVHAIFKFRYYKKQEIRMFRAQIERELSIRVRVNFVCMKIQSQYSESIIIGIL